MDDIEHIRHNLQAVYMQEARAVAMLLSRVHIECTSFRSDEVADLAVSTWTPQITAALAKLTALAEVLRSNGASTRHWYD